MDGNGAGRPRPHRGVPRRVGSCSRRLDHRRARRDRGHRRRVWVGQELDRDGDRGAPARTGAGDGRATPAFRARHSFSGQGGSTRAARALARDRLPGSDGVAQPGAACRSPARRGRRGARGPLAPRGEEAQRRASALGPNRIAREAGPQLPARALRRDAPASHDRHGSDGHPSADHCRRAHHGPRRDCPAADPQAAG